MQNKHPMPNITAIIQHILYRKIMSTITKTYNILRNCQIKQSSTIFNFANRLDSMPIALFCFFYRACFYQGPMACNYLGNRLCIREIPKGGYGDKYLRSMMLPPKEGIKQSM